MTADDVDFSGLESGLIRWVATATNMPEDLFSFRARTDATWRKHVFGPMAPQRKRRKRLAKKLRARHGLKRIPRPTTQRDWV